MSTSDTRYQDLEEAIKKATKKEGELYRRALQTDLCTALHRYNWDLDDNLKVKPLTSASPGDPLADYFFLVRDEFAYIDSGYIFPFRRVAIADRSPFIEVMKDVLFPKGYDVLSYTSHRGMPDVSYLLYFLKQGNSLKLRREERVSNGLAA